MNAYLFLWNPARDDQSFHDFDQVQSDAHAGKPYLTRWICPSTKPQPGDLAFVQRTGKENNGIFARGIVTSNPVKNDEGRRVVQLKLESFLPLNSEIKREALLAQSEYQYAWGPQASGTIIPPDLVNAITELWQVNHNLPINNPTRTQIGASTLTEDRGPFAGRNIDATLLADSSVAENTITGFLGDPSERLIALTQLIESADHANAVAPNAWGVTLHRNLFRLNVGRVEVLVVGEGTIRLNCVGRLGEPPFNGAEFESSNYRSVPDPQCTFVGPLAEFNAIKESIQRFHQRSLGRQCQEHHIAGAMRRACFPMHAILLRYFHRVETSKSIGRQLTSHFLTRRCLKERVCKFRSTRMNETLQPEIDAFNIMAPPA